jgi:hypothetical protein
LKEIDKLIDSLFEVIATDTKARECVKVTINSTIA